MVPRHILPILLTIGALAMPCSAQLQQQDKLPFIQHLVLNPPTSKDPKDVLYKETIPGVVRVDVKFEDESTSIGAGFLIGRAGLIATNYHVIEGAVDGVVRFRDGEEKQILGVVAYDKQQDLALLLVKFDEKDKDRPTLKLAGKNPEAGDGILVIGNPHGFGNSITSGKVSTIIMADELAEALPENKEHTLLQASNQWIQIDVAINSSNSGGPLLAADGTVVGVNSWSHQGRDRQAKEMNFAVPIEKLRGLITKANENPVHLREVTRKEFGKVPSMQEVHQGETLRKMDTGEDWLPSRRYSDAQVTTQNALTLKNLQCRDCVGKGTRQRRVIQPRGSSVHDHFENEPCPTCQGTGLCSTRATFLQAGNLAAQAMLIDTQRVNPERLAGAQTGARETLAKVALNRGSSARLCNQAAIELLSAADRNKGKPVVCYAHIFSKMETNVGNVYLAYLYESNKYVLVHVEQRAVDHRGWYFVAGLVAGEVTSVMGDKIYRNPGIAAFAVVPVH